MLAMTLYPEVQRIAQDSIDRVVYDRLPDFSDYDALPYIHAVVLESFRLNPVVALSESLWMLLP